MLLPIQVDGVDASPGSKPCWPTWACVAHLMLLSSSNFAHGVHVLQFAAEPQMRSLRSDISCCAGYVKEQRVHNVSRCGLTAAALEVAILWQESFNRCTIHRFACGLCCCMQEWRQALSACKRIAATPGDHVMVISGPKNPAATCDNIMSQLHSYSRH
jgi:hypothetical protein